MKIYPNKSNITVTKEVNPLTDIPLGYVDTNSISYSVSTIINEDFKLAETKELYPLDKIDKNYICLFDKDGNQIEYEELLKSFTREGSNYVYMPHGVQSFTPKRFEYNVTAKKKSKYKSNMHYNINALVYNNTELANNLMPIFGDAPKRLLAPSNIIINNGDLSLDALTKSSIKDVDITFLRLKNHETLIENGFDGELTEEMFDKETYLEHYKANMFAFYDNSFAIKDYEIDDTIVTYQDPEELQKVKMYQSEFEEIYSLKSPLIYDSVSIISDKYFNVPKDTDKVKYYNLFNDSNRAPILIEEHVGVAFMVYAPENLSIQTTKFANILYEFISYIYLNRYITTDTFSDWITDVIPDYIVNNKKLIKKDKFVSNIEMYKMFGLSADEITNYKVNIDEKLYPFVKFTGVEENYLTFEKYLGENNEFADPIEKPKNYISLYQQPNVYFYDNFIYKINDSIEDCIKVEKIDNEIVINLKSFRHSDSGIYVKYPQETLRIPLTYIENDTEQQIQNADFYLICKPNESVSSFEYINANNYKEEDGLILATIQVRQDTTEKFIYDMRQRGGGLPEGEKDNYDCFDIGHIYGRPYRKGGTLIITLPKRLKQHEDIIKNVVKQYSVAENYPIIIFEEDK